MLFSKLAALTVLCFATAEAAYPLFKQCDSRWQSDLMGTSPNTICQAGQIISSVAMVLNGCGRTIDGSEATPKTLNKWLTNNGGYTGGDMFVWNSVDSFNIQF